VVLRGLEKRIEPKLRTSIVEGISVFLSLFDDSPVVKRTFCPPAELLRPDRERRLQVWQASAFVLLVDRERQAVSPSIFPVAMNAGLAKALGVMMKARFRAGGADRIPQIEAYPERHFRQVLSSAMSSSISATVGESEPHGTINFSICRGSQNASPSLPRRGISSLNRPAGRDLANASADLSNKRFF